MRCVNLRFDTIIKNNVADSHWSMGFLRIHRRNHTHTRVHGTTSFHTKRTWRKNKFYVYLQSSVVKIHVGPVVPFRTYVINIQYVLKNINTPAPESWIQYISILDISARAGAKGRSDAPHFADQGTF